MGILALFGFYGVVAFAFAACEKKVAAIIALFTLGVIVSLTMLFWPLAAYHSNNADESDNFSKSGSVSQYGHAMGVDDCYAAARPAKDQKDGYIFL